VLEISQFSEIRVWRRREKSSAPPWKVASGDPIFVSRSVCFVHHTGWSRNQTPEYLGQSSQRPPSYEIKFSWGLGLGGLCVLCELGARESCFLNWQNQRC